MTSPGPRFVDGIVVRIFPYRDTQYLVRIIGAEIGKVSALIRYGKTSGRRFGARLDLFDCGTFELTAGKGSMLIIGSFQPKATLPNLRADLDKLTFASLLCESFDHLTVEAGHHLEESHGHFGYYERLFHSIANINAAPSRSEVVRAGFFGLVDLLHLHGVLADEPLPLSTNTFRRLLDEVERHSEKALESRVAVLDVLESLRTAPKSPLPPGSLP